MREREEGGGRETGRKRGRETVRETQTHTDRDAVVPLIYAIISCFLYVP